MPSPMCKPLGRPMLSGMGAMGRPMGVRPSQGATTRVEYLFTASDSHTFPLTLAGPVTVTAIGQGGSNGGSGGSTAVKRRYFDRGSTLTFTITSGTVAVDGMTAPAGTAGTGGVVSGTPATGGDQNYTGGSSVGGYNDGMDNYSAHGGNAGGYGVISYAGAGGAGSTSVLGGTLSQAGGDYGGGGGQNGGGGGVTTGGQPLVAISYDAYV